MVKLSYFNLLSIFDGSTCYCPDCIGERFSIFTPEETTEVVETVSSGAVEQVFESFREAISICFDNKILVSLLLCSFIFAFISTIISSIRSVFNGE